MAPLEYSRRKYRVRGSRKGSTTPKDHCHLENALDEIHRATGPRKENTKPPDTMEAANRYIHISLTNAIMFLLCTSKLTQDVWHTTVKQD